MDSNLTISINSSGAVRQAKAVNRELGIMDVAGERASQRADIVSRSLRGLGAAAAGYASIAGLSTITRDLAEIQGINSRLSALTGDLAGQQAFLRQTTDETSASYVTLADSYSKLLPLYDAGLLSLDQAQTITKGLANAQAITGATSADLGRSIFGLAQGFSAGTLRAEELSQITDALPGLLQALDRAAGLAGGGFRKLVLDGEVTSDFFRDTLIVALEDYEGAAAALSGNIEQTFNRTRNAYTQAVEAFNAPISSSLIPVAEGLADAFGLIAENAEGITDAAELAAIAIGAIFVGQAGSRAANFIADLTATSRAILSASEAATAAASAESAAGAARSRNNLIDVVRTGNITRLAEANAALASTSSTLVASEARLAEVSALTTTAINTSALSFDRAATAALGYRSSLATLTTTAATARAALSNPIQALPSAASNAIITDDIADYYRRTGEEAQAAGPRVVGFGQSAGAAGAASKSAAASVLLLSSSTKTSAASALSANVALAASAVRHKAYQAGVLASATATRGFNLALGLVGGPAGAITIAAVGLGYLITRQTEAEKAISSLTDELGRLEDGFYSSAAAAQSSADGQIASSIESIKALREELVEIQRQEALFGSLLVAREEDDVFDDIDKLQRLIERLTDKAEEFSETMASASAFDVQFAADAAGAFDLVADRAGKARVILEELTNTPDDKKRRTLEEYTNQLQAALDIDAISAEEFAQGTRAIEEQLRGLGDYEERSRAAAAAARELESIVASALPERSRAIEYADQLQILEAAYERGGDQAGVYAQAIEALEQRFNERVAQEVTESLREFNEVISRRIRTPFDGYRQDLTLLNDALDEMPEKAAQINLALANLDLEVQSELTVIESADNIAQLERFYDQQQQSLNEWHDIRESDEDDAQRDLTALHASYIDERERLVKESTDRIREFIAASNSSAASDAFRPKGDASGANLELARDAALAQAEAIADEQQRADALLAINIAYQDKLTDVFRSGEFTRAQFQQASFSQQLAGVINRYQSEINLVGGFVDAIVGLEVQRREADAAESLSVAQRLAEESQAAQQAFEQNGSDQNRIAAEQAAERAAIAETAARRDFEQQKKAQLVQARISQALAIVNAYASGGGNFLVGAALAATALAVTERQINTIKAQQFNGGSSLTSTAGGASVGGGSALSSADQPAAQESAGGSTVILIEDSRQFETQREKDIARGLSLSRLVDEDIITQDQAGALGFDNLPTTEVRRVTL